MIDREYNRFHPVCDGCEIELPEVNSFEDAIAEMKREGWHFKKYGSEWTHLCPRCQAEVDFG